LRNGTIAFFYAGTNAANRIIPCSDSNRIRVRIEYYKQLRNDAIAWRFRSWRHSMTLMQVMWTQRFTSTLVKNCP